VRGETRTDTISLLHGGQIEKGPPSSDSSNGYGRRYRIVVIGGSRSYAFLKRLKRYPVDLAVIVNTASIGKNSGPAGGDLGLSLFDDLHQCLSALMDDSPEVEAISQGFGFRFGKGPFSMALETISKLVVATNDDTR
jgi:2-phospho-L-lactate transferase/gluconeogenesis factor (CofD/UPF0052 family)